MKNKKITLPIRFKGDAIAFSYDTQLIRIDFAGNQYIYFINSRLFFGFLTLILVGITYIAIQRSQKDAYADNSNQIPAVKVTYTQSNEAYQDAVGYFIDYFEQNDYAEPTTIKTTKEKFMVEKQLLITKFLLEEKVSRLDQLSDRALLVLAQRISDAFVTLILKNQQVEPHVYTYFTNQEDLQKIETAIIEQIKYHIPASITLAQSALETAYGKRVIDNNYFGIKDKSGKGVPTTTTEYYNEAEYKANKNKVQRVEKVIKGGKQLYKCIVRDHFTAYDTPWQSFRAHSVFLSTNERYAPLFTGGKNYKTWAEKIGSTKYGGVGYATSPIYGELLKKIICRYQLHLLDF
jgi:hypothetical protein